MSPQPLVRIRPRAAAPALATARATLRLATAGVATALLSVGCSLISPPPPASDATIIVLADRTPSGMASAEGQRRHIRDVVIPLATDSRAKVVLATIVDNARTDPDIRATVSFDTSSAQGNPDTANDLIAAATTTLNHRLDALFTGDPKTKSSDVAGAVSWAAQTLANSRRAWHAIVVLSDATSTAAPCNMTLLRPSVNLAAAIASCFPAGVPQFGGTQLFFLGAGTDPTGTLGPEDAAGIEAFWQQVAAAGHGMIRAYGATVLEAPK